MKDLRRLAYEFELDQSHCKWVAKRNGKLNASRKLALTWVNLRVHLARALKKRDFGDMMKLSEPKMKAIIVNYLETWKSSRHKIRKDDSLPICVASETLTE